MFLGKSGFFSRLPGLERRSPQTIALAIAAILAVYVAYWVFLTAQLQTGFENLKDEQARNLVQLSASAQGRAGFPAKAGLSLKNLSLQKAGTPDFRYDAPALTVALAPFDPTHGSIASGPGAQHLVFHDAREQIALDMTSDKIEGKIVLKDFAGAFDHAQLGLENLSGTWSNSGAGGDAQAPDTFRAAHAEAIIRPGYFAQDGEPQKETVFALSGDNITVPDRAAKILGPLVTFATIDAQLTGGKGGPFSLDALARDGVRAIRTFFEGDGRLDITTFALRWGSLDANAHGALGLDALHRPVGTLMVEVAGYRDVLNGLVKEAVLEQKEADTIAGTLDLLAAMRHDPRGRVAVLLICQKGKLFIGPLEVATLKPLF